MTRVPASDNPGQPLWVPLIVAALCHALVIVGIRFQTAPPRELHTPTLRVSLVGEPNQIRPKDETPEAGADHLGGGMPTEPSLEFQSPTKQSFPNLPSGAVPTPATVEPLPVPESSADIESTETAEQPSAPDPLELIEATEASERSPEADDEPKKPAKSRAAATELMRQARQLARLSPGTSLPISRGDAPKSHGASTRFSLLEAYKEDWVRKVQDWGTRNFPKEARKKGLKGQLRLRVTLRYDGQIQSITLFESSGHQSLDQAAVDIVELAAPYAPFSAQLRAEYGDFLTIDRTWQFVQGNKLTSH